MCGFIGIISKNKKRFPEKTLERMTSMITHRGPDDSGIFFHEDWLAIGFRRLSILDLTEKGRQPMISSDKRYVIAYNGEIYNYLEIRKELASKGVVFNSESDTEVILEAYREFGEKCVDKFIGMFAFFLVDLHEGSAFIARDQLGIKPLFFYEDNSYYIFCSEIKSLLPYCPFEPDITTLNEYLVFRSVIGEKTMFHNVKSLRQGHSLTYNKNKFTENKFFDPSLSINPCRNRSFSETCNEVEIQLINSVKLHLRSDVDIGIQLSGGVDSSLITAIASKETNQTFHTFSISFPEAFLNEAEYQKRVSDRYGTEHHDYPMNEDIFSERLLKAIWHYEHPLNDPSTVAVLYLSEKAKKHATVLLSGEGGDESFLGYNRFNPDAIRTWRIRNWLYHHPTIRNSLLKTWPFQKGKALLKISNYSPTMYASSYADLGLTDQLLKGDDSGMEFRKEVTESADGDLLRELILNDQACDIQQWLWRADRMGMASSLETRTPFCTVPMFSIANSIPYKQQIRSGEKKAVLKKIAEKYIDKDQIYRMKVGFGVANDKWLSGSGSYNSLFRHYMESEKFKKRKHIDIDFFNRLYSEKKAGVYKEYNCGYLWTFFNLEIWWQLFFEDGWKTL